MPAVHIDAIARSPRKTALSGASGSVLDKIGAPALALDKPVQSLVLDRIGVEGRDSSTGNRMEDGFQDEAPGPSYLDHVGQSEESDTGLPKAPWQPLSSSGRGEHRNGIGSSPGERAEKGGCLQNGSTSQLWPDERGGAEKQTSQKQGAAASPRLGQVHKGGRIQDGQIREPSPLRKGVATSRTVESDTGAAVSDGATCTSGVRSDSEGTPRPDTDLNSRSWFQRSSERPTTSDASFSGPESMDYSLPAKRRSQKLKFLGAVKHRIKRAFSFSLPRIKALEEVLSGLQAANGGQPVPDSLREDIRTHLEKLLVRYSEAIFQPDEVLLHMRLLHEVSQHPESTPLLHISSFQTYSGFLSLLSSRKVKKRRSRRTVSESLERKLPNRNLSLNDLLSAEQLAGAPCSSESPSESGFSPSEASVSSTEDDFLGEEFDSDTVMHSVVYADVSHVNVEDLTLLLRKRGLRVKKGRGYHLSSGGTLGMLLLKGGVAHDLRSSIRDAFKEAREKVQSKLRLIVPNPSGLGQTLRQGFGRTASEGRIADESPRWDFGEIEQWISESGLDGTRDEETQKTVRGIENMMTGKGPMGCWLLDRKQLRMGDKFADGASGEVYRAVYKGEEVAVKVLRGRFGSSAQVRLHCDPIFFL